MSKVSSVMNMGQRSMMNAQTGLQTVSHNIANKNTEGFTRQRLEVQATAPTEMGRVQIGTGSKTTAVTRTNNPHLEKQIQGEQMKMGFEEGKMAHLNRVENIFNEQVNKGLNHFMGEFFNAFRELSNTPESLPVRTQVKESASNLAQDFKRVNEQLKGIQGEVDTEITGEIGEINRITEEIASLNQKVESIEITGAQANDHRDRRDLLLKQLGEKINIKSTEIEGGKVNVSAGGTIVLVSGYDSAILSAHDTPEKGNKREGNKDIFFKLSKDSTEFNVTNQITGGKLGGMLDVRDKVINGMLEKVDKLAYTMAESVNEVHQMGYDQKSRPAVGFFKMEGEERDFSARIDVSDTIKKDVSFIAAGLMPDAPADNRIANVISSLQYKPLLNGKDTLDDYYHGVVGELSMVTKKAKSTVENQAEALSQLKNLRESISGVSIDEETVKMIEYQKAFDASAKLIKTADEMLDTVINLKR
jgi:flagellar hook-associated protein 1 FlgK